MGKGRIFYRLVQLHGIMHIGELQEGQEHIIHHTHHDPVPRTMLDTQWIVSKCHYSQHHMYNLKTVLNTLICL